MDGEAGPVDDQLIILLSPRPFFESYGKKCEIYTMVQLPQLRHQGVVGRG